VIRTELYRTTVASRRRCNEVRVCSAICCSQTGQPLVQSCKKKEERIEDVPPQLKLIVVLGLQYAALAKNVKGVNSEICAELRVVMLCLLEG
jgi:transcriptional regulator of met regulon